MACGTVTIASNKASLAEVLPTGYSLQFDPGNDEELASTLLAGIMDGDARRDAARDGLARSRRFSWDNAARLHVELFGDLINTYEG